MTWFVEGLPVTAGNEIQIYLDGQEYCKDLYFAIRNARHSVFLTGLHFMSDFKLVRGPLPRADMKTELASVLAEAGMRGVRVYLLVNQFWSDEDDVRRRMNSTAAAGGPLLGMINLETWRESLRHFLIEEGGLYDYLPETYKLFSALRGVLNVTCYTDIHPKTSTFGTHHQKTVVVDDRIAFLGGIDLTYIDGDRWDTNDHGTNHRNTSRTEKFWHDIHCQIRGPAVDFVRDNFIQRWNHGNLHRLSKDSTGSILARRVPSGPERPNLAAFHRAKPHPVPKGDESGLIQIVRSMPADYARDGRPAWTKSGETWERSCKDAYLLGIEAAKRYIYLENQWISDEDIWRALVQSAMRNRDNPEFRIILVLPNKPLAAAGLGANQDVNVSIQIRDVSIGIGERFGMFSLVKKFQQEKDPAQIYVHSKILIVDDCWALIGSANAGGISLEGHRPGRDQPDSELSAIIFDKKAVSDFRRRLWAEHLGGPVSAEYLPQDADRFRTVAGQVGRKGQKLRFFPGYKALPGVLYEDLDRAPHRWEFVAKRSSVIVPSFPESLAMSLPVSLIRPSFRVNLTPPPPPYEVECLFRWRCFLFDRLPESTTTTPIEMRSLEGDAVDDFTPHDAAYISEAGARLIESRVQDTAWGAIECRVGLVPMNKPGRPEKGFTVTYFCRFISRNRVSELSQAMRQLLPFWKP